MTVLYAMLPLTRVMIPKNHCLSPEIQNLYLPFQSHDGTGTHDLKSTMIISSPSIARKHDLHPLAKSTLPRLEGTPAASCLRTTSPYDTEPQPTYRTGENPKKLSIDLKIDPADLQFSMIPVYFRCPRPAGMCGTPRDVFLTSWANTRRIVESKLTHSHPFHIQDARSPLISI